MLLVQVLYNFTAQLLMLSSSCVSINSVTFSTTPGWCDFGFQVWNEFVSIAGAIRKHTNFDFEYISSLWNLEPRGGGGVAS